MQRKLTFLHRSEDEEIKEAGLTIDLDEIAKKGNMSKEEKNIAKWYGIYTSRQTGAFMARVVIPGGVISSAQARNIAKVAEDYAQGRLNVTTRQALQFHWLKVGILPDMIRDLAREESTTYHGCGDVTRNVAACPLAATCTFARHNVLPDAIETANYLTNSKDLDNLPRKFKITFSGCQASCAQPYMNCVGNIAVQKGTGDNIEKGYKIVIGGGMGWKAFVAQDLFSFVPKEKIKDINRAIALLFRDHGDRYNRAKSRLKFVVHRYGIDKCRDIVLDFLRQENISLEGLQWTPIEETGGEIPDRPLTVEDPIGTDGKATVRAMIPKGELWHNQLIRLAELSEEYGDQKIYTTNRQNIELNGVDPDKVGALKKEISALGFGIEGFFGIKDIVPCVGTTYCPKAVAATRDLYDLLQPVVHNSKFKAIEKKVLINITGCPNSCSPYRIVDIGFRGMRIREELGSVEGFEMLIGGDQQKHGTKLGDFKKEDCSEIVEKVLDIFLEKRVGEENLTDTVNRLGIEPFQEALV